MPRTHREGIKPEPLATEVQSGQAWKHRWVERTVKVRTRMAGHRWMVDSEGRERYAIAESTLKRDYRLVP